MIKSVSLTKKNSFFKKKEVVKEKKKGGRERKRERGEKKSRNKKNKKKKGKINVFINKLEGTVLLSGFFFLCYIVKSIPQLSK